MIRKGGNRLPVDSTLRAAGHFQRKTSVHTHRGGYQRGSSTPTRRRRERPLQVRMGQFSSARASFSYCSKDPHHWPECCRCNLPSPKKTTVPTESRSPASEEAARNQFRYRL